jgi:hypothetical protein
MNEKTRKVFNGWLGLTEEERAQLQAAIRDFNVSNSTKQTEIRESVRKSATRMETGPLGRGCPCCGR